MRILICTHYWHPHLGGIETVAYEQATRLAGLGHTVSVVTSSVGGVTPPTDNHFEVYRVPAGNMLADRWGIPYPLFSPSLFGLLNRLIPRHDVVLAHGHVYLPSVLSAVLARRYNKPLVLFQHNPFVRFRRPWGVVEQIADRTIGRLALRSATKLMAQSRYTADFVRELLPGRDVTIIANGVDTARFRPVTDRRARACLRRRLGLPVDGFIALTIRRLVYRNGLDVLLDAAAALRQRPDIHVVIGGRGPERHLLEASIRDRHLDRCHLVGSIPDDLLPLYYQAADAFVLPTRTGEGFGLVLLEAFATGIPVVAAAGGGQDEVVEHEQTGLFVPAEDPAALARAIDRLYADPDALAAMGANALRRAREYDWERQIAKLDDFLALTAGVGA
ncbi:MAG: glycosyltransferase family 4 protein [Chloroflexi bacterium]|nr:glycosyltransferase family 4 protein [Chloroflexota bacterium]